MATSPSEYVNSPVSGTTYFAKLWAGCIPNNGASWTATVRCWSGANGTGSLVSVSSLQAINQDFTTSTNDNSFTASGNTVTATTSASSNGSNIMKPGGKYVGSGVGSLELFSTYTGTAYVPSVTSFTPSGGGPGTSVTITGNHFTDATYVQFNGVAASSFTINSMTSITAIVPSGASVGHITVGNPAGSGSSSTNFTPFNTPTITSFSPGVGAPGTAVTLTGTGFTGATAVDFNGTAVGSFTVVSDTSITTTVPTGATAGPVHVTNPAGTGASSSNFTPGQIYYGDPSGSGVVHQPVAMKYGDPSGSGVVHTVVAVFIGTALKRIW